MFILLPALMAAVFFDEKLETESRYYCCAIVYCSSLIIADFLDELKLDIRRPINLNAKGKNKNNFFFVFDDRINEAFMCLAVSMMNSMEHDIRVGRCGTAPTEHLFATLRRIMCQKNTKESLTQAMHIYLKRQCNPKISGRKLEDRITSIGEKFELEEILDYVMSRILVIFEHIGMPIHVRFKDYYEPGIVEEACVYRCI